jgi:hypothetical protein
MKDLARINDIIETSDQGIQAENDQDNYHTLDEMEVMALNNSPPPTPATPTPADSTPA